MDWNLGSEVLFHRPAAEAFLRPAWEVVGRPQDAELLRAIIRSVLAGDVYEGVEWEQPVPDGGTRDLLWNAFPAARPHGSDLRRRHRLHGHLRARAGGAGASGERGALAARPARQQRRHLGLERARRPAVRFRPLPPRLRGRDRGGSAPAGGAQPEPRGRSRRTVRSRRVSRTPGSGGSIPKIGRARPRRSRRTSTGGRPSTVPNTASAAPTAPAGGCWTGARRSGTGTGRWRGSPARSQTSPSASGPGDDPGPRRRLEFQKRELEEANRRLEALATEDGLTGLKNHRAFQERLAMEMERARRHGLPAVRRPAGRGRVQTVQRRLRPPRRRRGSPHGGRLPASPASREADEVARYGGEEFALILPHTDTAAAMIVASRCRSVIESAPWPNRP